VATVSHQSYTGLVDGSVLFNLHVVNVKEDIAAVTPSELSKRLTTPSLVNHTASQHSSGCSSHDRQLTYRTSVPNAIHRIHCARDVEFFATAALSRFSVVPQHIGKLGTDRVESQRDFSCMLVTLDISVVTREVKSE
jgi:hypothetical protein